MAVAYAQDGEIEVVLDAQPPEQARGLEGPGEPQAGACPGGRVGDVPPEQLHRSRGRRELPRDQVEQRRLAGAVRPENRPPLPGADREVDAGDGQDAAEAPVDPPQAEDRLGALSGWCGGRGHFPKETSSALPTQGGGVFLTHFGLLRSGAGVLLLKNPPNVWSTSGMRRNVSTSGTPSPFLSLTIRFTKMLLIAWWLSSSLTSPYGASSPASVTPASASWSFFGSEMSPSTCSSALTSACPAV